MKFTSIFLMMVFSTACLASAAEWTTDYRAALDQANTQNKLVLIDFTGSDWCGFCKLLDKEVLTEPGFQSYVDPIFILVKIDLPHHTELPEELKQQNAGLKRQFRVHEFPSLIVVDQSGRELGRIAGYHPGSGTDEVISKLKDIVNQK